MSGFSMRSATDELQTWLRDWSAIRQEWSALRDRTMAHLALLDRFSEHFRGAPVRRASLKEVAELLRLMEGDLLWRRLLRAADAGSPRQALAGPPPEEILRAAQVLRNFYAEELGRQQDVDDLEAAVRSASEAELPRLRQGMRRLSRLEELVRELTAFK